MEAQQAYLELQGIEKRALEEEGITAVLSGGPVVRLGTCKSDLESWASVRV